MNKYIALIIACCFTALTGCANSVPPLSCGGITGKQCPINQVCVDNPSDTCDPKQGGADCIGICQSNPKVISCGGITGKQCPIDQICVDDPTDTCDPKQGGADCSGICKANSK